MSKEKKAALFLFLVVGVIVLWGALTGWTFSGRLPQEGAKCTPDEGSKDENSEEYIYNADKECLIVNTCKEGWKPNSSNTACISTLSGDTCTGANENGIYKYDTSGECVLDSCVTGFEKSGTECISTLSGDTCTGAVENGIYKYDTSGECVFDSCVTGFEKSGTECISTLSGDTCTGANENGIYKYDTNGECVLDSLSHDVGTPIMCTANDVGSGENRAVYRYMGGVELRHYPNPEIAHSWDKKWGDFKKIDCGGLTQGDPMPHNTNTTDHETRLNELGGVIFLDRHDVSCKNGALNQFKLYKTGNQMQYKYRCVEGIPGYSLGTPLNAEFVTTAKNMDYRSLRGINVDCGSKPVGRFRLNRRGTNGSTTDWRDIGYNYTCLNNDVNSSTCQTKTTEASETGGVDILTSSDVSCGDNEVITQFELKKNDENKYYYEYKCCEL